MSVDHHTNPTPDDGHSAPPCMTEPEARRVAVAHAVDAGAGDDLAPLVRCGRCGRHGWHTTERCPEQANVDTGERVHPGGPFPTIRPIQCASWCSDGDGHRRETSRADQTCWGASHYVELSLEEVAVEVDGTAAHVIWPSVIGPCASRGFNELPYVYLHFTLQEHSRGQELDDSCKLTADEARELAAALVAVADEIDGGAK